MSKAWKKLDLEGGGLQAVNARLASTMRSRPAAYGAWLLFPVGGHRFYLHEPVGAVAFIAGSAATAALAVLAPALWWLLPAAPVAALAAFDLIWIDRRVTRYNKELRMRAFLRKGNRPPQDYRGRYTSDEDAQRELQEYQEVKEGERPGQPGPAGANDRDRDAGGKRRMPSFNEQEAMLRQMRQRRQDDED
ncbi:hypothetical protein [Thioalkalivibrio sp. ALE19]|uniref:hypothetical protein n=1 Tax=Thioalkalivibrio sp. ALE19 TaxID=1266909 RepID=UPI0004911F7F|nr:hypothetical protein [Thioalkalivibrio sp. ALE19]